MKQLLLITALFAMFALTACQRPITDQAFNTNTSPAGDTASSSVVSSPTITAAFINNVLCNHSSPACGTGQSLYDLGVQYHIDDAFALAVFNHESNYGTKGVARYTRSLGNLRPVPSEAFERDGYAAFLTWQSGYEAWYKLISGPLYVGSGLVTPSQIMPRYAPVGDNNNPYQYSSDVVESMQEWRLQSV